MSIPGTHADRTGRRPARLAVVVVLAATLGACGGDAPSGDDPAATAEAAAAGGCALVSAEEVEVATGFTVLGQEEQYDGCRWTIEQVDPDVLESAISWQPFDGAQLDSQRQAGEAGMDVADLDGIGDEAISLSNHTGDHPLGEVWVRVGDTSFRITNEFSTARYAGSLDTQAALAAVVADKLGQA